MHTKVCYCVLLIGKAVAVIQSVKMIGEATVIFPENVVFFG